MDRIGLDMGGFASDLEGRESTTGPFVLTNSDPWFTDSTWLLCLKYWKGVSGLSDLVRGMEFHRRHRRMKSFRD